MLLSQLKRWLASKKRKRRKEKAVCPSGEEVAKAATPQGDAELTHKMSNLSKSYDRLPTVFVKDCGYIPLVLTNAAAIIEKHIKTKDLFQTQGLASKISSSLSQLSKSRVTKIKNASVHDVIEALKTFLVRLPEPLFPDDVCDALIAASQADSTNNYSAILAEFRKSAPHHFAILHFMMRLLHKVSLYSEYNYMDVRKLATIFVLDVIKPLNLEDSNDSLFLTERMQRLPYLIMVIENLISNVSVFRALNSGTISPLTGSPSARSLPKPRSTSPTGSKSTCEMASPPVTMKSMEKSPMVECRQGDSVVATSLSAGSVNRPAVQEGARSTPVITQLARLTEASCNDQLCTVKSEHSGLKLRVPNEDGGGAAPSTPTRTAIIQKETSPLKTERSPEGKDIGTQAGRSQTRDMKVKKNSPVRASGKQKSSANAADTTMKTPVRKKRTLSKSKIVNPPNTEIKAVPSTEKKHVMRPKNIHHVTPEIKRRRRTRSNNKKAKHEHTGSGCCSRNSDFAAFQPDEEIAPWNDTATNSDDTSVMTKTIRNPRILSSHSSKFLSRDGQHSDSQGTCNRRPQLLVTMEYERERPQPSTSGSSTSFSKTTISRTEEPQDKGRMYVSHSLHYASKEVAALSEELIKGIHVKSGIGIVSDVRNKALPPNNKLVKRDLPYNYVKKNLENTHARLQGAREKLVANSRLTYTEPEKGPGLGEPKPKPSSDRLKPEGRTVNNKAVSDLVAPPRGTTVRQVALRPHHHEQPQQPQQHNMRVTVTSHRPGSGGRCPETNRVQIRETAVFQQRNFESCCTEWFVDIFLICITLFCTCMVFYIHQYKRSSDLFYGS